ASRSARESGTRFIRAGAAGEVRLYSCRTGQADLGYLSARRRDQGAVPSLDQGRRTAEWLDAQLPEAKNGETDASGKVDVRYWLLADLQFAVTDVRFRGKADTNQAL